jgi:glycosyltransferase involved in cell wall biosynthesis
LNILVTTPNYPPRYGGVGTHVRDLCIALKARGVDSRILTLDTNLSKLMIDYDNGIPIVHVPSHAIGFELPRLHELLKLPRCAADLIHAHSYQCLLTPYAALLAERRGRLVVTPHYHPIASTHFLELLRAAYYPTGAKTLKAAYRVVHVSHHEGKLLANDFPFLQSKLAWIPCGVDHVKFRRAEDVESEDGLSWILYVGRLEPYKGILELVRVVRQLSSSHRVGLWIVGSGPLKASLLAMRDSLGLRERIRFSAEVSEEDLIRIYSISKLLVLPSKYEAFGLAAAEAMSCELPVIASRMGGLPELVADGVTGHLLDVPVEQHVLAEKIRDLLADEKKRRRMGSAGRSRIITEFSLDKTVQAHLELYQYARSALT